MFKILAVLSQGKPYYLLNEISDSVKIPPSTCVGILTRLIEGDVPGLILTNDNGRYRVDKWGEVINRKAARSAYISLNLDADNS